jgi:hypothetical protein
MVTLFASFLMFFSLLAVARRLVHKYNEKKFRYKLYSIRDNLRQLGIEGKVHCSSKAFDFYDLSLSKLIDASYYITFFYVITAAIKSKEDEETRTFLAQIEAETKENQHLVKIQQDLSRAVTKQMIVQHYITYLILRAILTPFKGVYYLRKKANVFSESIFRLPQTSAIQDLQLSE